MSTAVAGKGLAGVVAANSGICWIDGDAGVLAYRGIDIHELAEKSTFEESSYLLWFGKLPRRAELEEFNRRLAEAREVSREAQAAVKRALSGGANVFEVASGGDECRCAVRNRYCPGGQARCLWRKLNVPTP